MIWMEHDESQEMALQRYSDGISSVGRCIRPSDSLIFVGWHAPQADPVLASDMLPLSTDCTNIDSEATKAR